ncbi:MAG: enhanced serine sensitivity protein SseB C-terminal domain-containing protein [Xanthomonadales bacterium]|nr:enhanced serine sensitivity protein SseB C-terminal domain-containing protein [Xanthomonadales bacterium]
MRNELQRLLDLANHEPGYAPEFYRGLLTSDVFALVPEVGHGLEEGKLRFVMWRGADGSEIIPYFSSIPLLENALQPGWQGVKLTGRYFLELTRGATVVLDPNEAAYCRLLPTEVTLLLETGAVSNPQRATPTGEPMRAFQAVDTPPTATLLSLSVLFAQHASVHRAYLVYCSPADQPEARYYLIVIRMDGPEAEQLVRESAQVLLDMPPDLTTDLITCFDDAHAPLLRAAELANPFYDKSWGGRMMPMAHTRPT